MSKTNNLVKIAQILIEMKEERDLHGVPASVMSRYPDGSCGIVINEDKYIVLNSFGVSDEPEKVNELKDRSLKYNANFYLGTHETDEPDIIDDAHNKSKLINEAYTEVSFLQKDIYSQAPFDRVEGRNALRSVIDPIEFGPNDFDDYKVDSPTYSGSDVYDKIYRCRCIFNDISGNESVESLLIKAYRVSNKKGSEYSYNVIGSDNVKEQVEELENKVVADTTGEMRSCFSKISEAEYEDVKKNIRAGIEKYYEENSKKFYRLIRVDIKAIYCIRLKKNPMVVHLLVDGSMIAEFPTYYSMVSGGFNVFTCPNCDTLSSETRSYDGIKIHVDHDFIDTEDERMIGTKRPIGCTDCMEKCSKCGAWHFKLNQFNSVISKGFLPVSSRRFLKNYSGRDVDPSSLCSCKEYLSWVYDEMSEVNRNGQTYYEKIVDKFLNGACKLVFINYPTGEVVADYGDFINYLYEYLSIYLKKKPSAYKVFKALGTGRTNEEGRKERIHNFIDAYLTDKEGAFNDVPVENYVRQAFSDYKKSLADALNVRDVDIKATSSVAVAVCECCGGRYFNGGTSHGEIYFNTIKNQCCCCAEATSHDYRIWTRADDGVTFYKRKSSDVVIRTYLSNRGELLFDQWLVSAKRGIVNKLRIKDGDIENAKDN